MKTKQRKVQSNITDFTSTVIQTLRTLPRAECIALAKRLGVKPLRSKSCKATNDRILAAIKAGKAGYRIEVQFSPPLNANQVFRTPVFIKKFRNYKG